MVREWSEEVPENISPKPEMRSSAEPERHSPKELSGILNYPGINYEKRERSDFRHII
jgi:hypothetical protein